MCPWLSASLDCPFFIAPSFIYICYVYATKQNFIEKTNKQEIDCYYFMYLLDNYRCSMLIYIIYLINSSIAVSSYLQRKMLSNVFDISPLKRNSKNWLHLRTETLQKKIENSGRASCHKQSETSRLNMIIRLIKYEETWRVTTILR